MKTRHWKTSFMLIWAGQAVSLLSTSVLQMALIWHLTFTTQSALVLSMASIAAFLPQAVFGTVAGTLVDRWNRKHVMIFADLFIAAMAAILAVVALFQPLPIWLIFVVLFFRSIGTAFHTPALGAVTPLIVPEDMLAKTAGYSQSIQSVSLIFGPAVAAVIYPIWHMSAIVALDVGGALLACLTVLLVFIPDIERAPGSGGTGLAGIFDEMKAGLRVLQAHRGLYQLLMIGFAYMFVFGPVSALFPLMSVQHFGGTTTHASIAEIAFAGGMLVGGLILGVWGGFKNHAYSIAGSIALMGAALAVSGALPPGGFVGFAIACLVMGLSVPVYTGIQMALFQQKIAPEYLGRVFGLYGSAMSFAMPLGLVASGIFADRIGVSRWFFVSGLLIVVIAFVCLSLRDVRKLRNEPNVDVEAASGTDT